METYHLCVLRGGVQGWDLGGGAAHANRGIQGQ